MRKEVVDAELRYYPGIYLGGLRKTMKSPSKIVGVPAKI
jgi:hypothetical protein